MRENASMKRLKKFFVIILLLFALLLFNTGVSAQTTTLTPTSTVTTTLTPTTTASVTATVAPTKVTSLPKTGIMQYGIVFAVVSIGAILIALVF